MSQEQKAVAHIKPIPEAERVRRLLLLTRLVPETLLLMGYGALLARVVLVPAAKQEFKPGLARIRRLPAAELLVPVLLLKVVQEVPL
jgi:hypothetical protein